MFQVFGVLKSHGTQITFSLPPSSLMHELFQVLEMAPWHRAWAVNRLAGRIATCVERASASNRKARGIEMQPIKDDESPWDEDIMPEPSTPAGVYTPRSAALPDSVWTYPEVMKAGGDDTTKIDPWLQVGLTKISNILRGRAVWWGVD